MKTISFVVPCYNSAEYMDQCIESLLLAGKDVEIILVNDGSTKDATPEKIDEWAEKYPEIIRAIHQENKGHGGAVNTGLANATGLYFKVVDSDDHLYEEGLHEVMEYLREQRAAEAPTDLVVANYVYDHVLDGLQTVMSYSNVFPVNQQFTWGEVGRFKVSQYLLMHSAIYRTELLKSTNLQLPQHCFYVDNIFVYVPLPFVDTIYYMDTNLYSYFIGREDQSVNEEIMKGRISHQLTITKYMISSVILPDDVPQKRLCKYMSNYLSMMMCICTVFLKMINTEKAMEDLEDIWNYLETKNPGAYDIVKDNPLSVLSNLPGEAGRELTLKGYHIAQRLFGFN